MTMSLEEFQSLKLHVVPKFSVGFVEKGQFVALTLHHSPPSALMREREPAKLAVLLTLDQADELAAQLAENRQKAQPDPKA